MKKPAPRLPQLRLSGTNASILLKLMYAALPTSRSRKVTRYTAAPWTPSCTTLSGWTSTAGTTPPCRATATGPPTASCTATRPMLGLFRSRISPCTGTFGRMAIGFYTLWTRPMQDQRPDHLGPRPDARGRGDRHLPGADGRPEVPGERERGNTAQHEQVRRRRP